MFDFLKGWRRVPRGWPTPDPAPEPPTMGLLQLGREIHEAAVAERAREEALENADLTVTEKAMRPASKERRCFYCQVEIGGQHRAICVLVKKKVRLRLTVEFDSSEPASWDKNMVEFHRNDSSWCAGNVIRELEALDEANGCLCPVAEFECLDDQGAPFLEEK